MVFYQGRAPAGRKTTWKMNEYKAVADDGEDDRNATAGHQTAAPLRVIKLVAGFFFFLKFETLH
jgi:hypothetical protein